MRIFLVWDSAGHVMRRESDCRPGTTDQVFLLYRILVLIPRRPRILKLEDSFIGYYKDVFVKLEGKGILLMVKWTYFLTQSTWFSIFMLPPVKGLTWFEGNKSTVWFLGVEYLRIQGISLPGGIAQAALQEDCQAFEDFILCSLSDKSAHLKLIGIFSGIEATEKQKFIFIISWLSQN